jgi:hypothetical protein
LQHFKQEEQEVMQMVFNAAVYFVAAGEDVLEVKEYILSIEFFLKNQNILISSS